MWIKNINHTRLHWNYSDFYRTDFHKFSLTRSSTCFETHGRPFQTLGQTFQTLGRFFQSLARAFKSLRENQKLSREFEKSLAVRFNTTYAAPISHGSLVKKMKEKCFTFYSIKLNAKVSTKLSGDGWFFSAEATVTHNIFETNSSFHAK